jgi:structure-specific endonuclease subunit SLX1
MDEASRGPPKKPQAKLDSVEDPVNDPMNDPVTTGPPIGIHALDLGYTALKPQLEKTQHLLRQPAAPKCRICSKNVLPSGATTLVCTNIDCAAATHLQCLSSFFLASEGSIDALVPIKGHCPECNIVLHWVDMVKELSLRMRGEKEVKALFKPKRPKKAAAETAQDDSDATSDEDDPLDLVLEDQDGWHELEDSSDDETVRKIVQAGPSPGHASAVFRRPNLAQSYSEPVIEDSDWDEAELVT